MLFMVTNRRIQNGKYGDEEQPQFKFDYLYDYMNGPQGNDGFNKKGKRGFEAALFTEMKRLKNAEGVNTPKVGIYLHGYHNDWQDSIDEIVDLRKALTDEIGYESIIVGFSWPSMGRTVGYLSDREEVRDSVPAFVRFLRDINEFLTRNERKCFCTSYCIAHSMGNYLLRKGMEYLSDHLGTPAGRLMFNETVMLAPDIAAKDIERDGKGQYIAHFSRRVHVYYSKHDRALKASSIKRIGQNRLGRHGANDYQNLASNVILVDAKKYADPRVMKDAKDKAGNPLRDRKGNNISVHSSHRYHPNIIADIVHVFSSIDRSLIPTRREVSKVDSAVGLPPNHYELI